MNFDEMRAGVAAYKAQIAMANFERAWNAWRANGQVALLGTTLMQREGARGWFFRGRA